MAVKKRGLKRNKPNNKRGERMSKADREYLGIVSRKQEELNKIENPLVRISKGGKLKYKEKLPNLYQIVSFIEMLAEEGKDQEVINSIYGLAKEKADAIVFVKERIKSNIESSKQQLKDFSSQYKQGLENLQKASDRYDNGLLAVIEKVGGNIKGNSGTIYTQVEDELVIKEEEEIPNDFRNTEFKITFGNDCEKLLAGVLAQLHTLESEGKVKLTGKKMTINQPKLKAHLKTHNEEYAILKPKKSVRYRKTQVKEEE